jgi:hypothetical protein
MERVDGTFQGEAVMKRIVLIAAFFALLAGCATQKIVQREFYPPDESTLHVREDGMRIGALKSETTKSGQPDWSGNKSFSLFSW